MTGRKRAGGEKKATTQGTALRKRRDRNRVADDRTLVTGTSAAGGPRKTTLLAVVNALFYVARTGCQWRLLPGDFPHYSTVQR